MRMGSDQARDRFGCVRSARLATADGTGRPHLVPIVFTVVGDRLCTAVDAKPKGGNLLRRLANIAVNPRVSVLVDYYDDDWTQLWWARADGTAQLREIDRADVELLARRYPQYREQPPPGPLIVVTVERWSGWTADEPARPAARPR
ncbi:MAG: TIGR03668 family PPOX class F420-dependent oxidoreductase [Mycobacteriaceae bacterium]